MPITFSVFRKPLIESQIEQFIESIYPSQDSKVLGLKQQSPAALEQAAKQKAAAEEAKWDTSRLTYYAVRIWTTLTLRLSLHAPCRHGHSLLPLLSHGKSQSPRRVASLTMRAQIGAAWLFGARVDVALNQLKQGKISRPDPTEVQKIISRYDHGEL